jgi:hypothetical protein
VKRAQAVAIALGVLLLGLKWHSLRDVVVAIDHGDLLFADFAHHYYPTVAGENLRHGAPAGGFFYPAGFAAMLAPLGLFSLGVAEALWGVVLAASFGVIVFLLVREASNGRAGLAAAGAVIATTSVPVLHDLKWGQVSLPIVACAGAAFVLHARGRTWLPAALLGIAAGIKGYPIVFLAWFVARGDFRFALRAAGACAITLVLLPAIVLGPSHALFVQRVSTSSVLGAADGVLRDFNSQYAPAVLARTYGGWDATAVDVRAAGELGSFAALVVVVALALVVARSRAEAIAERRPLLGFVLVASTVPFWLRTSWSHYFVHLPIAQTLLASILAERGRPRDLFVLWALVAPSVFLSSVLGLFVTEGWWYYANDGALFYANALVILACAGVVVEAEVLQRTRGIITPVARWSASRATR